MDLRSPKQKLSAQRPYIEFGRFGNSGRQSIQVPRYYF